MITSHADSRRDHDSVRSSSSGRRVERKTANEITEPRMTATEYATVMMTAVWLTGPRLLTSVRRQIGHFPRACCGIPATVLEPGRVPVAAAVRAADQGTPEPEDHLTDPERML